MGQELKYLKSIISTGDATEGSLLIPKKIYDTLIDEQAKIVIPRSECAIYFGPGQIPGSSIDVDLINENTSDVRRVGEGAEIPIDAIGYTSINVKPLKYGVALRITREMKEDSKWPLLQWNIRIAGRRFAEKENALVIAQLDTTSNTTSGGAAITISDITASMQQLEENDYRPTTFLVGMEVLNDLRNIDTFVEANKIGNREMLSTGFIGNIYGMNVMKVSTNAGMTTTTAYIYDKDRAYMIAEKRPITIENFELPSFDMSAAAITQRIAVSYLRASAIATITTS